LNRRFRVPVSLDFQLFNAITMTMACQCFSLKIIDIFYCFKRRGHIRY
jgi:hypothetical protein